MLRRYLEGKKPFFFLAMYFSDVLMFLAGMYISYALLLSRDSSEIMDFFLRLSFFALLLLVVNFSAFGLYRDKRNLFDENEFLSILYSYSISFAIIIFFMLLFYIPNLIIATFLGMAISLALTVAARLLLYGLMYQFRRQGFDQRRVLFYGKHEKNLIDRIKENDSLGYRLVGIVSDVSELKSMLDKIDIVFVTQDFIDEKLLNVILRNNRVHWKIIPSAFNIILEPVSFDEFKDYPIINVSAKSLNKGYLGAKRMMDLIISGLSLLLLSPLFLLVAAIIKLTMPGPVFYRQERIGMGMKRFLLYKFRTMVPGADGMKTTMKNEVEGLFKMKRDPRVTRFGNILRRTCIDELPQLINIFKGDMAIVGPRPHLPGELSNFRGWRLARFQVKPGLTGMWQVNGRHELNFDKAVLYDIYYIRNMSFFLDLSIIIKTIPSIIFSRGRY